MGAVEEWKSTSPTYQNHYRYFFRQSLDWMVCSLEKRSWLFREQVSEPRQIWITWVAGFSIVSYSTDLILSMTTVHCCLEEVCAIIEDGLGFEMQFPSFRRSNRPIRLTQCCTQFKPLGIKILCVMNLHDNEAFTFKWYGNTWNKTFYSQKIWIGYNIELAELVKARSFLESSNPRFDDVRLFDIFNCSSRRQGEIQT